MAYWIFVKKRTVATLGRERDHYYNLDLANTIYLVGDGKAYIKFGESRAEEVEIADDAAVAQIKTYLQKQMQSE